MSATQAPAVDTRDSALPGTDAAVPDRISVGLCVGFGFGAIGVSILLNTITVMFPALMSTVLGQSTAVAGLLLTLSKLYDGIADLVIGNVSDKSHSRWGRRRPFMLVGAVVAGISFLLIFIPPDLKGGALIAWMTFALIVYSTGYALYSVPWIAMAGEMTDGYHERTRLLSYRTVFISIGQIGASYGAAQLITWGGGGSAGFALMGAVAAATVGFTMLVTVFGTSGARVVHATKTGRHFSRAELLGTLVSNRPFVLLMLIKISQYTAIAMISTTKLLFLLNVVKIGYAGFAMLTLIQNMVSVAVIPLWTWAGRRIGKRNAYLVATGLLALLYMSWYFTDETITQADIWVRGILNGIAAAGTTLLAIAMLPDVMEYDRRRTGLNREGAFSSVYTIVEKLGYALGAGLIGMLLGAAGYIATTKGALVQQPASAVAALYAGASWIPAALIMVSFVLMLFYSLDEKMLRATTLLAKR